MSFQCDFMLHTDPKFLVLALHWEKLNLLMM